MPDNNSKNESDVLRTVTGVSLTINAPQFFRDPEFVAWLNNGKPKMTWHQGGAPAEWSDVIVMIDPSLNGEGSDSDMPEHIWSQIVQACRKRFAYIGRRDLPSAGGCHIPIRLINLD